MSIVHPALEPARPAWLRLPRPTTVLAPTLPALLLLGLCVAGLSDPPDQPTHGSGTVSRLHVPTQDPDVAAQH